MVSGEILSSYCEGLRNFWCTPTVGWLIVAPFLGHNLFQISVGCVLHGVAEESRTNAALAGSRRSDACYCMGGTLFFLVGLFLLAG